MISVTKIFRFETAHAIYGYEGPCKHIHGHSYVLHVTVASAALGKEDYIKKPGFVVDFKVLKKIVLEAIVQRLDHKLILSKEYLQSNPANINAENLEAWVMEPSAENILFFSKQEISKVLPKNIKLVKLRLYETADSFAEWEETNVPVFAWRS